jgi:hypothetical protein
LSQAAANRAGVASTPVPIRLPLRVTRRQIYSGVLRTPYPWLIHFIDEVRLIGRTRGRLSSYRGFAESAPVSI